MKMVAQSKEEREIQFQQECRRLQHLIDSKISNQTISVERGSVNSPADQKKDLVMKSLGNMLSGGMMSNITSFNLGMLTINQVRIQ